MNSLLLLTKKNLKLLLRAKGSVLVVVFAPLLIILILGMSYNTSSNFGLNIGIYADSASADVNDFVNLLKNDNFTITDYNSSKTCIEDVKNGYLNTCIHLPASLKVEGNTKTEVNFYIDPSKINLVWMVQETVNEKFNFKSQEISEGITKNILTKFIDTKDKVTSQNLLVGTIKDKNNAVLKTITDTQTGLAGVDASIIDSSYDSTLVKTVSDGFKDGIDELDDAISEVDSTNISSSDKTSIKNEINSAKTKIKSAQSSFDGNGTATIKEVIDVLEKDLLLNQEKLLKVSGTVGSSNTQLAAAKASMQESIKSITAIHTSLSEVVKNLESQKVTDASTVTSPLITNINRVGEEGSFLNYLFPALLVLVVMFSSLLLGTTLVMMEKNSAAFLRNFFLPISKATFIISTYLTTVIMIAIEIFIILLISLLFLENILNVLPSVALILFVTASVFSFLGMGIGYIFTSEETGVLASISFGSLLLFISGVIIPLEGLTPALRGISLFNPFVISERLIRNVFIFKIPLLELLPDFILLIVYAIILFVLIWIIESVIHKHLISRFMKKNKKGHHKSKKKNA